MTTARPNILFLTAIAVGALAGTSARAQTAPCADTASPACADADTPITVTGSRLSGSALDSPSPLRVIDAAAIAEAGVVNVQEILLENPVFGSPTVSRTNSAFATSSAAIATIDLRSLGPDRTLVLVNGRRTVSGLPGSSAVDLNTIPTDFIERVEVLTGGASAIYGSDAVAGVVNIVYRRDFEGLLVNGQTGITDEGDGARYRLSATAGHGFGEGRGNIMVHGGYTREEAIGSAERANTRIDDTACFAVPNAQGGCLTTRAANVFVNYAPFFSPLSPNTTVTARPGFTRTYDAAGQLILANPAGLVHGDGVPSTVRACTNADPCSPSAALATGYNRQAARTIALPVERLLLAVRGRYEVADGISAFGEGNLAQTSTTTLIEPFGFQTAGPNGTAPTTCMAGVPMATCSGYHPIETRLADGSVVRNPFVSDALYAAAIDITGDRLRDVSFTKRLTELGPRTSSVERTNFRLLGGLEGTAFGAWRWDAFYGYSRTTERQRGTGQVDVRRFRDALEVIPSVAGPICASAAARADGCQPANVFGPEGSLSAAAVAYIQAPQTRDVRIDQKLAGANLSGELLQLWDGPLAVAVGAEYRRETSSAVNDALTRAGLNAGNAVPNTDGTFDVVEGYGELAVPLLADRPFFHQLTVRGSARVADYSTVGGTFSYNYGGDYAPVADVRLRVTQARATRAPNIAELFAGRSQTFPTGLVDPCIGVTATTAGALAANCRAAAGVAANIAANGVFTLNASDLLGVSGFTGGNRDLREETADSFTAGVVINPVSLGALRNLVLTVDYFDIDVVDAIVNTPRQYILDQCYRLGNQSLCGFVTRRPGALGPNSAGSLQSIDTGPTNGGQFTSEGIDATLTWRQPLEEWGLGQGTVSLRVAYTHLIRLEAQPQAGAAIDPIEGEVGAARDRLNGSIGYDGDGFGVTARGTFIGASYLDNLFAGAEAGNAGSEPYRVKGVFYLDLQARIAAGPNMLLSLGVDNATDETGPAIYTSLPGNDVGTDTDAGTYDPIGRRFYVGARLSF